MTRDWKPGDVAMMTWSVNADGPFAVIRDIGRWHMIGRGFPTSDDFLTDGWLDELAGVTIRPLVVIDPEDLEQVARLRGIVDGSDGPGFSNDLELWQAALREFANPTPPKPEEPTGLGAVVEDAEGVRWVREHRGWWIAATKPAQSTPHWSYIKAVRILSEGVES